MRKKRPDVLPEAPTIINASESHMALVFVLDVSYSMEENDKIGELNRGINRFKEEVCQDKRTRNIVDVAVIQFNDEFNIVQGFVPIEYMDFIQLEADGGTKYTEPIREALKMVDVRSRLYRRSGAEPYKPWVIFVTDGEPLDDITDICNEIYEMQAAEKVRFIALGVGNYNAGVLHKMTDVVMGLEDENFTSFFDWVNKSMRSISMSSPGEKPPLPKLEGNVRRVYDEVDDI